jgi:hypothetical protein
MDQQTGWKRFRPVWEAVFEQSRLSDDGDSLIHAAEESVFANFLWLKTCREPGDHLIPPDIQRERLKPEQNQAEDGAQGMEQGRAVIIEDHELSARFERPDRLAQCLASDRVGLFVEKEKQNSLIVARVGNLERYGVTLQGPNWSLPRKLVFEIFELAGNNYLIRQILW